MATNYPGALDSFTNPDAGAGDTLDDPPHGDQHADANDAIEAIETELGINPRGSEATVRARLDAIESAASDLPQGEIGYAEVTANQTVNNGDGETDLTGLSVTVDVGTSRRIRVSAQALVQVTSAETSIGRIKESTTNLALWHNNTLAANDQHLATGSVVLTPSSGSHTYRLTLADGSGGGDVVMIASSTIPAFILVEDLGPA